MSALKRFVLVPLFLGGALVLGYWAGPALHAAQARLFPEPEYVSGDYSTLLASNDAKVVMFSTSTCPFCAKTREYFEKNGTRYVDLVVDKSKEAEAHFKSLGVEAVPVIFVGDRRIVGFREKALTEALAQLHETAKGT